MPHVGLLELPKQVSFRGKRQDKVMSRGPAFLVQTGRGPEEGMGTATPSPRGIDFGMPMPLEKMTESVLTRCSPAGCRCVPPPGCPSALCPVEDHPGGLFDSGERTLPPSLFQRRVP